MNSTRTKLIPWEIEAAAIHIPKGGSERVLCPKCAGGTDSEKSLQIYVDEAFGFHWRCWRASCGYKGARGSDGMFTQHSQRSLGKKEPRYYTRPTKYPTPEQHEMIHARFGLEAGTVDRYSEAEDRFILPVMGPKLLLRGYVAYSLSGGMPKSINYPKHPGELFMHYARGGCLTRVVVEDWFSAEKVAAAGACGIAIMGTNISEDMLNELAETGTPTVLAFDRDAYPKSIEYQQKYQQRFKGGLKVWRLEKDLKYVSVDRIQRGLNGDTDFIGSNQGAQCV